MTDYGLKMIFGSRITEEDEKELKEKRDITIDRNGGVIIVRHRGEVIAEGKE